MFRPPLMALFSARPRFVAHAYASGRRMDAAGSAGFLLPVSKKVLCEHLRTGSQCSCSFLKPAGLRLCGRSLKLPGSPGRVLIFLYNLGRKISSELSTLSFAPWNNFGLFTFGVLGTSTTDNVFECINGACQC